MSEMYEKITSLEPRPRPGNSEYGSRVTPVLAFYASLTSSADRRAFQDALERMLADERETVRKFAVDICLGFFVFRLPCQVIACPFEARKTWSFLGSSTIEAC